MARIEITGEQLARQRGFSEKIKERVGGGKVFIRTFGCQQNEADSERLLGMACEMGYTPTGEESEADLIIVNTCAIREHAELKTLSITGQYKHIKEKKPGLVIVMCGCMVSQEHRIGDVKNRYPYVDLTVGTDSLWRFPELLFGVLDGEKRLFCPNTGDGVIAEGLPVRRESTFEAWVSIMYGCNNFCSYCVVPYVRGRERSRRPEEIEKEVRELAEAGYREITLLGQNVNSYGKDLPAGGNPGGESFASLLRRLCAIPGDFRLRFMTSHPKDVSDELIAVMGEYSRMAKHFHLPAQSGSDAVLKAMNRHYDRKWYLDKVRRLREAAPDIALSTDIIVGFPGETEEDFAQTESLLREVCFDFFYLFEYSPRPGTPAAKMENQIPTEVKKARFQRLLSVQNEISLQKNRSFEGQTVKVLVLGPSKTDPNRFTGRTERQRLVHFDCTDETLIGNYADVKITKGETYALYGELVGRE